MERKFRSLLLRFLGAEAYLALISGIYIRLIRAGFLKQKYPELFFLKELVKAGSVSVDIGANIGYYSVQLSNYAGPSGQVHAVEPIALFAGILKKNIQKFASDNVSVYQTALGGEQKKIRMGTPVVEGVFRHGLTKVVDELAPEDQFTYEVDMNVPDRLFTNLVRFDFLKCDVEGYEVHIMPHFMKTIMKFRPVIQMEISTEDNRKAIFNLLEPAGYGIFRLSNNSLVEMSRGDALQYVRGDFYFKIKG